MKVMKTDFTPSFSEEKFFWDKGVSHVIGIDEVGRGCFAGPVVTAGVIFHSEYLSQFEESVSDMFSWLHQIHDSKVLVKTTREKLAPLIQKHCMHFAIVSIEVPTINTMGIGKATFLGMQQVVNQLIQVIGHTNIAILVDAFTIPEVSVIQKPIIKGDQKSISIAAASIIAKVYRDNLMDQLAKNYGGYDFANNKGYGTKKHRDAIHMLGLSDVHRSSFNLKKYS